MEIFQWVKKYFQSELGNWEMAKEQELENENKPVEQNNAKKCQQKKKK